MMPKPACSLPQNSSLGDFEGRIETLGFGWAMRAK
jgi:hypothetical protein